MTRRFPSRTIALALALALCAAGVMAFCGVGRWLVREDPLGPADTIMVLSGGVPARAEEAARIFRQGYAHEVWVSKPESPSGELAEMGIQYLGEDDYNREILIHEGVPEADVHVLPDVIVDTEQEVEEIAKQMHGEGKTSVIIVTSPEHTRRVKVLSRKLPGENLRAIVRGAPQDRFDANHWWRDTRDVFSVVREILGLLNAWAGLLVQPRSP